MIGRPYLASPSRIIYDGARKVLLRYSQILNYLSGYIPSIYPHLQYIKYLQALYVFIP